MNNKISEFNEKQKDILLIAVAVLLHILSMWCIYRMLSA